MRPTLQRPTAATSVLVVVDVQDKLVAKIPTASSLLTTLKFLLDSAALFQVPGRATEQYPKGLGGTHPDIAQRLSGELPSKTAFSCCGAAGFLTDLRTIGRTSVVLSGMETHVCVSQTALDLLEAGFQVFIPADGVAARFSLDHEIALRRLEQAGAVVTTAEAVAFEWAGDAAHPQFKAFSKLVVERSALR